MSAIELRWTDGLGRIDFPMPEKAEIRALGISLRPAVAPTRLVVRLNGIELMQTEIGSDWTQRFELAGLDNQSGIELEIESDAVKFGPRRLGVALLDAWIERTAPAGQPLSNARTLTRFQQDGAWWTQQEVILEEIFSQPEKLRYLIFQGGEPFLVKEFEDILDVCIQSGVASQVTFEIVSNMTVLRDSTLEKLARLKHVSLGGSIDGIGATLEYIRYPAKWAEIEANLQRVSQLPNVQITFNTAVQLYNLLDVANILRYCDSNGWDSHMHFLVGPRYLNALVLPRAAREVAKQRVRAYLAESRRPQNRAAAEYVLTFLDSHDKAHYRKEFANFVRFTNDMDVSRGQNFRALYPDLLDWFAADGLPWNNETRFATVPGTDGAHTKPAAGESAVPAPTRARFFWRQMLRLRPKRLLALTRG